MNIAHTNFGLTGWSTADHDHFFGKKGRRRRKERRARRDERRSIRFERRRLKNDDRRASTEAKRAETAIMQATMLETPTNEVPAASATPTGSASRSAQAEVPVTQQAGFGGNALFITVGVLIVGGYLVMRKRQPSADPNIQPDPQTLMHQ